ncbi:hypothetical protein Fmac_021716 [Flemingia macrophylla]|uniref:Uncharacterized protein n=1 Tax=Flemingia macrophylla TaxID=520843 RepID=A0ABD1LXM6_9FABA
MAKMLTCYIRSNYFVVWVSTTFLTKPYYALLLFLAPCCPSPHLADKFHGAIKDHHHRSPSPYSTAPHSTPTLTIPDLSLHFSTLSASHPIFPSVARHVLEKCVFIRHGISFLQSLAFFNWATVLLAFPSSMEPYHEMLDLAGKLRHFDLV